MSDYKLEDTIFLLFTTRQFSDGVPTVLAGTPAIDIYEDATATPIITGETLVVDLNSVVGLNVITITATAGTGFNAGGFYSAVIQAGTVGGVSVVGEVVATFSLDASAAAVDLANATDGLGALKTLLDAIPTTAMRGTDSVDTATMRGTDSAALASEVTSERMATLTDWIDGGRLDLLLDAIKTATDKLNFTVANKLDANIHRVNNVLVKGTGVEGDEWGPA